MSGRKFNLLDAAFWSALCEAAEMLDRTGWPYCVVGGTAVQIWTAALLTREGEVSIDRQPALSLRLRTTRDVDMSTEADPSDMLTTLNQWATLGKPPISVLSPRAIKLREILVNLTLEPDDVTGFRERYREILENAVPLRLRRGNQALVVPVESLEELLATKLTRKGHQAKDLVDADMLCQCAIEASRRIDEARILSWLAGKTTALTLLSTYQHRYPEAFRT